MNAGMHYLLFLFCYHFFYLTFTELTTYQDDEYAWAGVEDPKVVVTTSHDPSSKLKQFAKVLCCTITKWVAIIVIITGGTTRIPQCSEAQQRAICHWAADRCLSC